MYQFRKIGVTSVNPKTTGGKKHLGKMDESSGVWAATVIKTGKENKN